MNINFNIIIQKIIPYLWILLCAYAISTIIFIFLPKNGIDFISKSNQNLAYKKYDGFYLSKSLMKKETKKEMNRGSLSDYLLKAIYSTTSNAGWIIVQKNSKSHILSQNEELDGYTLIKLFKNFVIFEKNNKEFKLEMKKDDEKNTSYEINRTTNSGKKEDIIVDEGSVRVKRSYLNSYVQDIDKVWKNISIQEIRTNGKIDGFKVLNVNKNSVFTKLGLKKGDIIKSVNNNVLGSYSDAFRVYNNISNIQYLNIEILRNNEIMELNYEID